MLFLSRASARCAAQLRSEPVMRPLGGALSFLERGGAKRMRIAPHEHRDHHLGLDSQAFLERATYAPHDALLVAADRALRQCGDLVCKLPRPRECLPA